MGRFSKSLGNFEMKVGDEELNLKVELEDISKLLAMQRVYATDQENLVKKQVEKYIEILKRSYPEEPDEDIKAFLTKNLTSFIMEFSIASGWATRKDFEDSFRKKRTDRKPEEDKGDA